ncbi:hypothetical protein H9P43_006760 [Blastocladiella emersonii ATCC 22665]|nr:hypothetical protein H9P43_006760 [Blastocladiella emersonii ATCC 22665]
MPNMLAGSLLTARSNVTPELFSVYALFLDQAMSDNQARKLFLDVTDPNWRPDWVKRWHALKLRPGESVREFFPRFIEIVEEVIKVTAARRGSRELKQIFADKVFYSIGHAADPITEMAYLNKYTLDAVVEHEQSVAALNVMNARLQLMQTALQSRITPGASLQAASMMADSFVLFNAVQAQHRAFGDAAPPAHAPSSAATPLRGAQPLERVQPQQLPSPETSPRRRSPGSCSPSPTASAARDVKCLYCYALLTERPLPRSPPRVKQHDAKVCQRLANSQNMAMVIHTAFRSLPQPARPPVGTPPPRPPPGKTDKALVDCVLDLARKLKPSCKTREHWVAYAGLRGMARIGSDKRRAKRIHRMLELLYAMESAPEGLTAGAALQLAIGRVDARKTKKVDA